MDNTMVAFDTDKYHRLKKAYNQAVADKKSSFLFQENEFVTSYAKYVLEYLKPQFENESTNNK